MLDDTIDAIKIYGHFISIYLIKLFIYFILLYLYVIRNKFACINFYISFFLYRDEDGKREEKFERTSHLKRRDKTNNWIRIEIGTKEERLHRVKRRNNRVLLLFSRIMSRVYFVCSVGRSEGRTSWREINSYRALLSFHRYSSAFFSETHPSNFTASTRLGRPLCIKPFQPDNP